MSPHVSTSAASLHALLRSCPRHTLRTLAPTARLPLVPRPYHSHEHPPPPDPLGAEERAILAAAYRHVPEHGFSPHALAAGARDAGFLDTSPAVLADGPFSLILYHLHTCRKGLSSSPNAENSGDAHIRAETLARRVELLTWQRLAANAPVIHKWQDALAIMAQPSYVPTCVAELAALADDIWALAGDKSLDASWYAKRAALSAVYGSAELFMTNDSSLDYTDTRRFLTRRLEEMQSMGALVGSLSQWAGFTAQAAVNVLRSKGAPL